LDYFQHSRDAAEIFRKILDHRIEDNAIAASAYEGRVGAQLGEHVIVAVRRIQEYKNTVKAVDRKPR
jgi:hypothetical protein